MASIVPLFATRTALTWFCQTAARSKIVFFAMKSYGYKNIYGHNCTAVDVKKDVIDLEIPGNDTRSRLKRWWNDLFLLSYKDKRAAHYYLSPYAMLVARTAQYRNNRGQIHPFSKFKNAWDCLMLHILMIHMFMFHLNTSILHCPLAFYHYLLASIEYMFFLDIYINAKTGYTIEKTRRIVMNSNEVLWNYLSTKSFIHVMSSIPLENILILRLGKLVNESYTKANMLVCTLKFISLIHIVKLFQLSAFWAKERETFKRTVVFKFIRIIFVGLMVMVKILTFVSAVNIMVCNWTVKPGHQSYLLMLLLLKYSKKHPYLTNETTLLVRLSSRLCKSLFLFGYSMQPNIDALDHITSILTYAAAFMFHFWAAVVLYNCIARYCSLDDYLYVTMKQTNTLLRVRGLPDVTNDKVAKYFEYKTSCLRVIEKRNSLFKSLPPILKTQIKMHCYRRLLENIPCFSDWPIEVISKVVELLKSEIYLEGDVLASAKSQLEGLVVVEAGTLAVYSDKEEGHFEDGDYYGVEALVTDTDFTLTVAAVCPSMVLLLDRFEFRRMMNNYRELFDKLKAEIDSKNVLIKPSVTQTTTPLS